MEDFFNFETLEESNGKLYVSVRRASEGVIASSRTGLPNKSYLKIGVTIDEIHANILQVYGKMPINTIDSKDPLLKLELLFGEELKEYITKVYGEDLELFVDCSTKDNKFWISNVDGDINSETPEMESVCRRPGYLMRGKSVTPEQATEIFIRSCRDTQDYLDFPILFMNFYTMFTCSYPRGGPSKFNAPVRSWIGLDGTIGSDAITQKYPNMKEYIEELTELAFEFPYLDLIIVITNNEEWGGGVNIQKIMDSVTEVDCAFLVKEGRVTILPRNEICETFREYYEKYDVNLLNGNPVTYYHRGGDDLPYSVYNEDTHKNLFRPLGDDASFEDVEKWLLEQNEILKKRYYKIG